MKAKIIRSPFSWWIVAAVVLSISAFLLFRPIPTVLATANSPVNSSLSSNVIHTGFADLVETVAPTVVSVRVERIALSESSNMMQEFFFNLPEEFQNSPFGQQLKKLNPEQLFPRDNRIPRNEQRRFRRDVGGSGVIIDSGGYVITNRHVIENAEKILVTTTDGMTYPANLVGEDEVADIAVLKIESDEVFRTSSLETLSKSE